MRLINLQNTFGVESRLEALMPDYEYHCRDCKEVFTTHQTIADHDKAAQPACPKCGSRNVEQLLSSATIITSKKS